MRGEVAPWIGESFAESGDGEGLAGSASDQKVDCSGFKGPGLVFGEASIVRDVGESVFEDGTWERFNFGESDWSPAEGMPGDAGCFHS